MHHDQNEENKMKAQNPAYDMNQKDSSEHLRSVLLIIAAVIGIGILLFSFFGPQWLGSIMAKAEGGYVQIGLAVVVTLLALSIISAIFRSIFSAATFATGATPSLKTKDPVFRIISAAIFLILAFFVFNYVLAFLSQNEFYKQLEGYLEKGVQIETEDGEKTIKLDNGEFTIEDAV